jgi:uncharacterized membrane protein
MSQAGTARARVFAPVPLLSILALLALVLAAGYARSRSHVVVGFSAHSASPARLQLFHDVAGRFLEARSDWITLDGRGWKTVSIPVAGADAMQLRLDPPVAGAVTVCGLGIDRSRPSPQVAVIASHQLAIDANGNCLHLLALAGADDPSVVLQLVDVSAERSTSAGHWRKTFLLLTLMWLLAMSWMTFKVSRTATGRRWIGMAGPAAARFDRNAHWILMALMLLFGTLYLAMTPPGAVADEEAHASKITRIASGVLFGDSGAAPMPDIVGMFGQFRDYPHNKRSFTARQVRQVVDRPLQCEPANPALPRSANGYFPLQYAGPAIVFKAGCATGASFGTFLYLSRFLNLLLGTLLVACGVRYAVRGKWALFLVALLPMTLFQVSSISADSLTLSASLAWLGLLSGIEGRTLDPRRAASWLLGLALGIALMKSGCAWVLLGLLFCKPAYDEAKASFPAAIVMMLAVPILVQAAWILHASGDAAIRSGVDMAANRNMLLHDPLTFVQILINTFSGENLMRLGRSMIGVLGWLDVVLGPWAYRLAAVALLLALFTNGNPAPPARGTRPLALLFALGSLVLSSIPLFVFWTLPGAAVVEGLQGRYFTISAAFVLVWCAFRTPPAVRTACIAVLLVAAPVMNVLAIQQLYDSYYVSGRPG